MSPKTRKNASYAVDSANTLSVMTYNVYCGKHWGEALATIRAHPVDMLCLQEVGDEHGSGPGFIRPSRITDALLGDWNFLPLWFRPPRRLGNMNILTRGTLGPPQELRVAPTEPYGTWSDVTLGECKFVLVNVHLAPLWGLPGIAFTHTEPHRFREARHLHSLLKQNKLPAIVTGDFNTFRPAPAYWAAKQGMIDCRRQVAGRHAGTRPTYGWPFVIDHIFVTPNFEVLDYRVIVAPGSDHRPVTARLRLAPHTV